MKEKINFSLPKINDKITANQLRVIDELGNNLGVFNLNEALALAQSKGLDLILISEKANPPIAKIMAYDKYRYQKSKELKRQQQIKKEEKKEIQLSLGIAINDMNTKSRQIEKFLNEGNQVSIRIKLHGREKQNKSLALKKLEEFLKMITLNYKVLSEPNPRDPEIKILIKKA